MKIDERFLVVHERTVLWWKQRELCHKCKHCIHAIGHNGTKCAATPVAPVYREGVSPNLSNNMARVLTQRTGGAVCIDAREPGMPCGPEGKLFEPVVAP